jgi:DNA/RNA-binding domain of Phe-tRNA-synthetase-like protein
MTTFRYHPDILSQFPQVVGGVLVAREMRNGPTPDDLMARYLAEQQGTIARIGSTPLSEIESLAAWRSAFRGFGVNPTKYRSATEALLRRLTKKGDIPSINAVVDICNLVSIRYGLPVAAFDTRELTAPITVQFADGSESFTPLFQEVPEHPDPGEVIFADDAMLVVARRWCWRQSDESATQAGTTEAVFTIEAHHPGGYEEVGAGLHDLEELLAEFVGGEYLSGIVTQSQPEF